MFLEGIPCVQVTLPKVDIEPGNLGPQLDVFTAGYGSF